MFSFINNYLKALISVVLCLFTLFPSIVQQGKEAKQADIAEQTERLASLESLYSSEDYVPVDESKVTGFDVDGAYQSGIRFNEVSFIATHNSYQKSSVPAYIELIENLSVVSFGAMNREKPYYNSDTLTEQLNLGIRSIELDVETIVKGGKVSFACCHSPIIDARSTCYDFALALQEIKMWSDANKGHLPITIIIEPKKIFIPEPGMKFFDFDSVKHLDTLVKDVFGDKLLTPSDMIGNYDSFKDMRENDGWPLLEETAGHVMFLLHECSVTEKYISQDKSMRTQSMFPMLRYKDIDRDCTSFVLMNYPDQADEKSAELHEKHIIYRTMVDDYGVKDDEREAYAFKCGAQIMSTDYPIKSDIENAKKVVSFDNGATVRINTK